MGLPGGLAAARRSGLCLNAIEAPGCSLAAHMDGNASWPDDRSLVRTSLLFAFVSSGVPCLPMSALSSEELIRFAGVLAAIRRSHRDLLSPRKPYNAKRDVQWYGLGAPVDWSGESSSPTANAIAMTIQDTPSSSPQRAVCVALNPTYEAVTLNLPSAPSGSAWRLVVNTCAASPEDATLDGPVLSPGAFQSMGPKSGLLLLAVPYS